MKLIRVFWEKIKPNSVLEYRQLLSKLALWQSFIGSATFMLKIVPAVLALLGFSFWGDAKEENIQARKKLEVITKQLDSIYNAHRLALIDDSINLQHHKALSEFRNLAHSCQANFTHWHGDDRPLIQYTVSKLMDNYLFRVECILYLARDKNFTKMSAHEISVRIEAIHHMVGGFLTSTDSMQMNEEERQFHYLVSVDDYKRHHQLFCNQYSYNAHILWIGDIDDTFHKSFVEFNSEARKHRIKYEDFEKLHKKNPYLALHTYLDMLLYGLKQSKFFYENSENYFNHRKQWHNSKIKAHSKSLMRLQSAKQKPSK